MPLAPELEALIESANLATDRALPNPDAAPHLLDHSVGCAVLTRSGKVYTGVNIFHYTGGPCAESVALGNALQDGARPADFTHIVAVGNRRRGVISPCGKCRQILVDYYPHMKTIVIDKKNGGGLLVVDAEDLLPYGYLWSRDRGCDPEP